MHSALMCKQRQNHEGVRLIKMIDALVPRMAGKVTGRQAEALALSHIVSCVIVVVQLTSLRVTFFKSLNGDRVLISQGFLRIKDHPWVYCDRVHMVTFPPGNTAEFSFPASPTVRWGHRITFWVMGCWWP